MRYVLLFCGTDEEARAFASLPPEQLKANYARVGTWWQEHQSKIVSGEQLQPAQSATTVRKTLDGKEVITDGPYIEAKEQVGGFCVIDVPDLDEALRMARSWPAGSVEIRPVMSMDQRP